MIFDKKKSIYNVFIIRKKSFNKRKEKKKFDKFLN